MNSMTMNRWLRVVCMALIAGTSVPAWTQSAPCERACSTKVADQYLNALAYAQREEPAARHQCALHRERPGTLDALDGLWGTASAVGKYRQIFADSRGNEVGLFATLRENGMQILIATRLKMQAGRITEIENIVNRPTATSSPSFERMEREGSKPWSG